MKQMKNQENILSEECKPLDEEELDIEKQLSPDLALHIIGVNNIYALYEKCIEMIPAQKLKNISSSYKVITNILMKILNDLRSARVVALRGYSIQATIIISSLYESAFMAAYIANNDQLAENWISHNDPTKMHIQIYEITREGLRNIGSQDIEGEVKRDYSNYRQLCMLKHGNPLVQKYVGYELSAKTVEAVFGPQTNDESVRISWFALEKGIKYATIALTVFLKFHLNGYKLSEIMRLFEDIHGLQKELQKRATKRWGNENPFSDKL